MELTPDWVVGFVDGEGCFHVSVQPHPTLKTGYQVLPEFVVVQHQRDLPVLYALKRFFRCGVVRRDHDDRYAYRVRKLACLERICDFFLQHPLKTQKNVELRKFRRIVLMMKEGQHLNPEGLRKIVEIALKMNTQNRPSLEKVYQDLLHGQRYGPPPAETRGDR